MRSRHVQRRVQWRLSARSWLLPMTCRCVGRLDKWYRPVGQRCIMCIEEGGGSDVTHVVKVCRPFHVATNTRINTSPLGCAVVYVQRRRQITAERSMPISKRARTQPVLLRDG